MQKKFFNNYLVFLSLIIWHKTCENSETNVWYLKPEFQDNIFISSSKKKYISESVLLLEINHNR
jgi:hypothetical protein